jgi:hypothetical protein
VHAARLREEDPLPVRRAAVLAVVAALTLASPARAIQPGPQIFTWASASAPAVVVDECESSPATVSAGGFDGGPYLTDDNCTVPVLRFAEPQALVELYVRTGPVALQGPNQLVLEACAGNCGPPFIDSQTISPAPSDWTPVILEDPGGAATITDVELPTTRLPVDIDDLAISMSVAQPDTAIVAGPPASTGARSAAFTLGANQTQVTFGCASDGAPLVACPSRPTFAGVGLGRHTLTAAARDRWGRLDATAAAYGWTVIADIDLDGVLDAADNCPRAANRSQADTDADGIGDACELLPDGNVVPVAGANVVATAVRGDVFVKLPGARAGRASLFQDSGFVPLKGVAALPVGSVVDARNGSLAIRAAANSRRASDPRLKAHQARLAAGVFRIRQARNRRKPGRKIPTDFVLASGERVERVCAGGSRKRPRKRIVRRLTVSGKGVFRTVGGASVAVGRGATWITTDRCDGTLTEVGRGKVRVRDLRRKRTHLVRAGRGFFIKRAMFLPLKGVPLPR